MRNLYKEWKSQIEEYCKANGLSFEKAKKLTKNYIMNRYLILAYNDPEGGKNGLLEDMPAPPVLIIREDENGVLQFEQTEYTDIYLR